MESMFCWKFHAKKNVLFCSDIGQFSGNTQGAFRRRVQKKIIRGHTMVILIVCIYEHICSIIHLHAARPLFIAQSIIATRQTDYRLIKIIMQ
jgi:hypothetical protein